MKGSKEEQAINEYIDLGWWGFVIAGCISAFMAIGILTMSGSADFSAISKLAYTNNTDSDNATTEINIPLSLLKNVELSQQNQVNELIKVVAQHNLAEENNAVSRADRAFWTWIKIFSLSILSGFGGVGLVSSIYKQHFEKQQLNAIEEKIEKNTLEIQLQRARDFIKNNQYQDAIKVCDKILEGIYPNHPKALGIKARALSRLSRYEEATTILEQALAMSEMSEHTRARLHWNIACYTTISRIGEFLPDDLEVIEQQLAIIKTHLQQAIALDNHLRLKLKKECDLKALIHLKDSNIDWFDILCRC